MLQHVRKVANPHSLEGEFRELQHFLFKIEFNKYNNYQNICKLIFCQLLTNRFTILPLSNLKLLP